MKQLTMASLFDGSGGFPLASILAGIEPEWSSEIEPFPLRVTEKRLPSVKHMGNVIDIDGAEVEPVDIITFGSPCTDLSIAGKRAGLEGKQSGLFHQAIRIVKEMRKATDGKYPRYIVWENVPGAFSSNKGEDFRCVLEEICKVKDEDAAVPKADKWEHAGQIMGAGFSVAWRVFDAQYWGVPQRRQRIYLVADFDSWSAPKVLFESEGLSGYSAEGFRAWQRAANGAKEGSREAGNVYDGLMFDNHPLDSRVEGPVEISQTIGVFGSNGDNLPIVMESQMFENHGQDGRYTGPLDVSQTILSTFGTGGNNQPFVVETPKTMQVRCGKEGGGKGALIQDNKSATLSCNNNQRVFIPFGICAKDSNCMKSSNPNSGFYEAETARTLDANGGNPSCNQGGIAIAEKSYGFYPQMKAECVTLSEEKATCLVNGTNPGWQNGVVEKKSVAYGIGRPAFNQGYNARFSFSVEEEIEPTIVAKGPGAVAEPTYSTSKASFFTAVEEEKANTLVATDFKDPPLINAQNGTDYIVRRLTPVECARLQGFPDWWCSSLGEENPSDELVAKWKTVFENYTLALGKSSKPKSDKQIIKWLQNPHSDSAEYKMWGNGICLANAYFVLAGIAWANNKYN